MVGPAGPRLTVDVSTPAPVPPDAADRAVELIRSGWVFRYAEVPDHDTEASRLEADFAALLGLRYCAALNSCGSAIYAALRGAGLGVGDLVALNAFTLAPVPGAISHLGARAVLVEITEDLVIDLEDLQRKLDRYHPRALLLSHMRGHVADMDAVSKICDDHGVLLFEDCAHSLGAGWGGRPSGTFGVAGCFSTQSYKHLNSGEGGLLVTDDDELAATAVLLSGSYAFYGQHGARPSIATFERLRELVPNLSLRMSALAAALVRPQLGLLPQRVGEWNERYEMIEKRLEAMAHVRVPKRGEQEVWVGSSIQFYLDLDPDVLSKVLQICDARGLHIKWFGVAEPVGFTSTCRHWRFLDHEGDAPRTAEILSRLCDLRISAALSLEDCDTIGDVLEFAIHQHMGD